MLVLSQFFTLYVNAKRYSQSLPGATVISLTSTATTLSLFPAKTMPASTGELLYPFRERVKHLSPEERKAKYEEEIQRLFENSHESHNKRLTPEKIEIEKADVANVPGATITWNPMQTTYDIGKGALSQRSFKRCNRSKADPWRRYGALKKLHEIGGTGCAPPNQAGIRLHQKFYTILPGTHPPPPPVNPPITSIDDYGTTESLMAPRKKRSKSRTSEKSE